MHNYFSGRDPQPFSIPPRLDVRRNPITCVYNPSTYAVLINCICSYKRPPLLINSIIIARAIHAKTITTPHHSVVDTLSFIGFCGSPSYNSGNFIFLPLKYKPQCNSHYDAACKKRPCNKRPEPIDVSFIGYCVFSVPEPIHSGFTPL